MPTKPAHSPTPWYLSEPDPTVIQFGCEYQSIRHSRHIANAGGSADRLQGIDAEANAAHIVACVNGTDARTVALADALEVARAFINVIGFDSEVSNNVQAKILAALALL